MDSPPPRSIDHTMEMRKTMMMDDEDEEPDPEAMALAEELNQNDQSMKTQSLQTSQGTNQSNRRIKLQYQTGQ